MSEFNSTVSKSVKKPATFKPPVPARPKNLVVLNSKNLPKPPENVLTGNVTNFIKGLNLDSQDDATVHNSSAKNPNLERNAVTPNSDEEDIDGYLEPVSLSFGNVFTSSRNYFNKLPEIQKNGSEESPKMTSQMPLGHLNNLSVNAKEKAKVDCENMKQQHIPHSHRPLPLPPVKKECEVSEMPWYKNVDRKKGEELLKDGVDGYFLVRPSSKEDTFLTLTLWFHNRLYNIPIRKRRDGKYALGTPKTNEQCFSSIQEMVTNYQSEKLLLYSNGAKVGRTLLTTYPP